MADKKPDFEASMKRLEEIVRLLDSGTEGLDQSMKLYEEGVQLVRVCTEALDKAEQKIKMLSVQPDGTASMVDFQNGGEATE